MEVQQSIEAVLVRELAPAHLEIENESHRHSGTLPETHFKLVIVSDAFEGKRLVARHQQVYGLLAEPMAGPVHALALHTYTPSEWAARQQTAPASPNCMGGSRHDKA